MNRWMLLSALAVGVAGTAYASGGDPVAPILLALCVLFLGGRFGAFVATRLHQPAVLGELLMGVVLGNIALLGFDGLEFIEHSETIKMMAGIGVILLLFEVGLETDLDDLLKVGVTSFVVAILGVIAPFILGYFVSGWFLPEKPYYVHMFVGATLCATSVGLTARVLKDLNCLQKVESKIILGAAVIDDVLGLIILAVVAGIISGIAAGDVGGSVAVDTLIVGGKAFGFLVGALLIGIKLAPHLFRYGARLQQQGMLLTLSLSVCFLMSYLADMVGLAAIVGAFAAGLIIDGTGFQKYFAEADPLEETLLPLTGFFNPVFFVTMGMGVDLATFGNVSVLGLAAGLTFVAILGKQVCSLGVLQKGLNRIAVGIGMIPRGEVGLIFASIGAGLVVAGEPVIDKGLYSSIVIMVMVTTMITPPFLKWAMTKD